jgi:hypothetical protein
MSNKEWFVVLVLCFGMVKLINLLKAAGDNAETTQHVIDEVRGFWKR